MKKNVVRRNLTDKQLRASLRALMDFYSVRKRGWIKGWRLERLRVYYPGVVVVIVIMYRLIGYVNLFF